MQKLFADLPRCSSKGIAGVIAVALVGGCTGSSEPLGSDPGGPSQRPSTVAAPGLLAAYGFAEGAGTTTADASGAGITGTLSGAAWTTGRNGSGLSFNGTSSYVSLGNAAALGVTGSMSVSAWVNESANVGDDGIIIARSNGAGGWELKSSPDTGARTFAFGVYNPAGAYVGRYSRTVRALGAWYHVAGVYDAPAQALHVYVNGILDDGTLWGTVPASISAPSLSTNIGKRSADFNIKGVLDDVRVYGRALSQAEIQMDMNAPVGAASADTVAPSTPGGLSATAVSSSRIDLAWSTAADNVGVAGYRILRNGAAIATSAATSYSDLTASSSTTYSYAVSAFDAAGNESSPSAAASVTTPAATGGDSSSPAVSLSAPANGATVAGSAVVVSANASDNAGVAGVQFLLDGANLGAEDTTSPWSITWNTTSATPGSHVLSARARDAAGNVGTAANVSVVVDNQAPNGSVLINGGAPATRSTTATLTLSASDALAAVTQMRFSNTGTSFSAAEAYATTKAWTLSFGAGTKTVYVQFKDAAGNWSGSFTDTIVLDPTAPVISAVSASNITSSGTTIGWTTDEPATSQVEYGSTTSYGSLTAIDANLVTAHRVTLSGLEARTTYNYRVRSKDAAGNERVGSNGTFTTGDVVDTSPPTVPAGVAARALSSSQIAVSWTASTDDVGVAGYRIFRNGTQVASTTATSFRDSNLAPDTTCVYTVSAYDAANNTSAQSASASATTLPDTTPPSVPANLIAVAASSSRINLSWSASSDNVAVSGYAVFRDGVQIATASDPGYSDAGLAAATTYSYAVVAYDPAGNVSAQSAPATATTLPVISVTPSTSTVSLGGTKAFTCTVSLGGDTSCTWSIAEGPEGGSISSNGASSALYTAPGTPGTFHVIATSNADPASSSAATVAVNAATPTLVQHTSSSSNEQNGIAGNDYKFTLPNPVLSGNCLILGVTFGANPYSGTTAVTSITDSSGDTWSTTPDVSATDNGTAKSAIFVHPNATAGVHTITVTLSSSVTLFQYTMSEFSNVATTSPVNGSAGHAATISSGVISTGSFTPGNNDANGGNLIWAYFADDAAPFARVPTNYAPGGGFSLLDASIGTHSAQLPHGAEYFVQTKSAAVNPSMTLTGGGTSDTWTGVAVALKAAATGNAPGDGIRLIRTIHETNGAPPGTWNIQCPSSGNLIIITTNYDPNLTSITDNKSNTYTRSATAQQIWYAQNSTTGNDLRITLHYSASPGNRTIICWDTTGAATSAVEDGHVQNTLQSAPTTSSPFDLSDSPIITPASSGLTIATILMGIGPVDGFASGAPEGAIFDTVYYTGDMDSDRMDSGDAMAHCYNPDTAAEHWNWHIPNVDSASSDSIYAGSAAHFKAAPPQAQTAAAAQSSARATGVTLP